jgi:TrmH family RNA methyltransferase
MLLDGIHLVAEALDAGIPIREVALAAHTGQHPELDRLSKRLRDAGVEPVSVSASVMSAVSPVRSPSDIVATANRPDTAEARIYTAEVTAPLVVIAVDVQDPGNLGAMIRVAEAGGANGLIAAGACADPFSWKALRGSMGSALRLPVLLRQDSADAIADARRHACRIVATVPRGGKPPADVDLTGPVALLLGGEGPGLTDDDIAQADERLTIPMRPPVESLNAAVATALVVYEAMRQRNAKAQPSTLKSQL